MSAERRATVVLAILFVIFGASYAVVIPPGESPDEAAHVAYVDHILRNGALPPLPASFDHFNYEAHQPPLDYLVSAVVLKVVGDGAINYPFVPNSALNFDVRGSRAFVPTPASEQGEALLTLRLLRLFWGLVTLVSLMWIARRFTPDSSSGLATALPFVLGPQFLFISSSINNDVSVTAVSTVALALLVRLVSHEGWAMTACAAGLVAGLALSFKISAAFLAPVVAVAIVFLWPDKRRMLALLGGYGAMISVFVAGQFWRFGTLLPPLPRSQSAGDWSGLLHPSWIASAWVSFWGKFGWFNLPMNPLLYVLFLPATMAILAGMLLWRKRSSVPDRRALLLIDVAAIAIASLFVVYLAAVDWQPQGRYLFVAIGCAVAYAGRSLSGLQGKFWAVAASFGIAITGASAGLITILRAY